MREKRRLFVFILASALLSIISAGCSPDNIDNSSRAELVSLSVTPVNTSIAPGTTIQLSAIGRYSNNSTRNLTTSVTWDSSDTTIATISNLSGSRGLALASMITGSTTITAVSGSITGSTTLSTSPVASISLAPATPPSIAPGTKQQFTATATLEDGGLQNLTTLATWTSSILSVATVGDTPGSKGLATAHVAGSTNIEASYGSISSLVTLTTSSVVTIAVSPSNPSIANGTKLQFAATGTLQDITPQNLTTWATWTSSNPGVATISNATGQRGLASSHAEGPAIITALFSGISSTAQLTVTPATLTSIFTTPTSTDLALGRTLQFKATGTFTGDTTQDITSLAIWSLSNTSIATISNASGSNGLATSLSEGTCSITASLSGVTSNAATLRVTPPELLSISVAPASAVITQGATLQYTATGIYTDGTRDIAGLVNWNSSNTSIATISNLAESKGLATAPFFNIGTCSISADLSGITSNAATLTVQFQ